MLVNSDCEVSDNTLACAFDGSRQLTGSHNLCLVMTSSSQYFNYTVGLDRVIGKIKTMQFFAPHGSITLSLRFNGHFPGELGLAGVYWSKGRWKWWWQLELQVMQSSSQIIITNKPTPSFLQVGCPSCRPTASKHWRELLAAGAIWWLCRAVLRRAPPLGWWTLDPVQTISSACWSFMPNLVNSVIQFENP